jgi:hypothetical protein
MPEDTPPTGAFTVKLPKDILGIRLVPGTVLGVSGHLYAEDDGRVRVSLEFDVKAPQSATGEAESQKLTQAVKPLRLLEQMRYEKDMEDLLVANLEEQSISDLSFGAWANTNPGIFTAYTGLRDIFGLTNRRAWELYFTGAIPLFMPGGKRRAKTDAWDQLPAEEREARLRDWKPRRLQNELRISALSDQLDAYARDFELFRGSRNVIIERLDFADKPPVDEVAEPWLSRKAVHYMTIPRNMDPREGRKLAILNAEERGRRAQNRVEGSGPDWYKQEK